MALRHLKFFDKKGNDLTSVVDPIDGFFRMSVYLEPISVGLFETEHIFILEEILKQTNTIYSEKQKARVNIWQSTEIRILKYLESYGKSKLTKLDKFFAIQKIGDDLTDDFIRNHPKLFKRGSIGSDIYAENTPYGKKYLTEYEIGRAHV